MFFKFKFIFDVNIEDINTEKRCMLYFLFCNLERILKGSVRKVILFFKIWGDFYFSVLNIWKDNE